MRYKAVVFDLFGTLVDIYSRQEYQTMIADMASALAIPFEQFNRLWLDTAKQRGIGLFQSTEANIEHICKELDVAVSQVQLKQATMIRLDFTRRTMMADRGAMEIISDLKSKGYKLALISNCSPEAPVIWQELPFARFFDVTVFSCLVGLRKPDPSIYKLAAEQLAVKPDDCLYIGDGDGDELVGADRIGMNPVLMRYHDEDTHDALRNQETSSRVERPNNFISERYTVFAQEY